ncbi:MAG TPA: TetR/AcrR family transcriptional regulator [Ruminiclostridium sp.]|nr:TetR/AcrR family transcriptional regulator [Ruminiclostridium sp.]
MNKSDLDARNKIIKAAIEILNEIGDIDKITVRQIAARANVGTGLINYHFNTKDNLLSIAVGDIMAQMAAGFAQSGNCTDMEPISKLKHMLKELYSYAEQHEKLLQFTLNQNIQKGDMQTPLFLVPVLRGIFGEDRDEMNLRIIALQIIAPIQTTVLCPSEFHLYSGVNLRDKQQRNNFIDNLVDNLVNGIDK